MSTSQHISGGMTTALWRPKLIKLTSPDAVGFVRGSPIYIDPALIVFCRRLVDPKGDNLREEVTYIRFPSDGLYVVERPEEIYRLREEALSE